MKNFYENTFACLTKYNTVQDKMNFGNECTTNEEDEFCTNFPLYLAHALVKDTGEGQRARKELCQAAEIIKMVCEG